VYADVIPAVQSLHCDGIRTAVLSNWDGRLRPLLRRLDLARFFDPILVSCEVGHAKPDPEIFRLAAAALDLPPDQILHVGDDPVFDFAAARNAHLHAALIDRTSPHCAWPRIQFLTEIPGIVQNQSRKSEKIG
jgi:putative hydrolase of the HAD superfamily